MVRPLTLPLLALLATAAVAQNTCSSPLDIVAGTYTVDTIDGPDAPLPQCSTGGSVATRGEWYRYTAAENHTIVVSSDFAQNSGIDTRVQIYSGTCGALLCVGGDDDSGAGNLTVATFNVLAGQTFLIGWDNGYSSHGFDFSLSEQPWNPNALIFTNANITLLAGAYANAVVDMDNDGLDDAVSVTSTNIRIHRQQTDGTLVTEDHTTTTADYLPSWSMAAGDIDGNGHLDLLYGGGSGATFMKASADGSTYTEVSGPQYIFCQRTNFVDINNDGDLDAFVCHDVQPNTYFINDGTGNLAFNQGGLGDTPDGGNYGSIWIDYDGDHDIDMFIAKCRGGNQVPASIDQLHRNNGDGTFTDVAAPMGLADYQQSWSSAWADFDLDGDMDVLIGASSFVQGGHKLMRNDGNVFTDVTVGSGFDVFTGTSIEWVAHDFDCDGRVDILGANNTVHHNNGDWTFSPQVVSAASGPIGDLNNDGFLDVLNGGTVRLNTPNGNNWVRINLHGVNSNRNGIGARVEVHSPLGTQIRDVKSGDGFRYMSFLGTHFGLGTDEQIDLVRIYWPSGIVDEIENPAINTAHVFQESLTTNVADATNTGISLVSNPASEILRFNGVPAGRSLPAVVLDASGKLVLQATTHQDQLDITPLPAGAYTVRLQNVTGSVALRFVKQ